MTEQELIDFYMLTRVRGLGKKSLHKLISTYQNAGSILALSDREIDQILGQKTAENFKYTKRIWNKEKEYKKMIDMGIRIIPYSDESFPEKLRTIPDPPACLFVKGKLPDNNKPSVSIVGARMCSEYGRYASRQFGLGLAEAGIQIISGMALGVDGISQKAALKAGYPSYAVLGCSPEYCYPDGNRDVYDMLCQNGGIISEYAPGTPPEARLFPMRNRIISGLSDIVLVIEARKKSGTQITVDMALEQGKEIFAVPGRITDRLSDGCNELIRQGAGIALSPEDIISSLGTINRSSYAGNNSENHYEAKQLDFSDISSWQISTEESNPEQINVEENLSPLENAILNVMDIYPISATQIAQLLEKSGITEPVNVILSALTMMQLNGLIKSQGSYYIKTL
ncbi:DNA processing protein [Butyrivibrio fibrisolvens DSM 3071]|uniref:DNA processing protein n=1 Tax=Butyrivibrio fibrisolvens DSM 3071 TaxID=1121131 RepID=A0A1M5T3W8_BUTFI|nr:DNA-processing protein DprA [Butyrivibrio fibrisolvens]SHH45447.1 DNA processing protein [Butyrivibrio fibrisolvens DSM 3071]